jgi:uncharacterized membrane protein
VEKIMGWILMIVALIVVAFLLLFGFSLGRAARRGDEQMESALRDLKRPGDDVEDPTKK